MHQFCPHSWKPAPPSLVALIKGFIPITILYEYDFQHFTVKSQVFFFSTAQFHYKNDIIANDNWIRQEFSSSHEFLKKLHTREEQSVEGRRKILAETPDKQQGRKQIMAKSTGKSELSASPVCFLFHGISFISFLYIFCWHFGSEAATFSQSQRFGWFFKYLTFCGFTFQMIALLISFLSDLYSKANKEAFLADVLSCASFAIANVITVMFWSLLVITKNPVDQKVHEGKLLLPRPPLWLSLSVHLGNAIVAWVDILVSKRTFRKVSLLVALMFGFLYCIWMYICATKNEAYPYPFLNELPEPEGLIGVALIGMCFMLLFFKVGTKVAYAYGGASHNKLMKAS